jgi:hypothetical protein
VSGVPAPQSLHQPFVVGSGFGAVQLPALPIGQNQAIAYLARRVFEERLRNSTLLLGQSGEISHRLSSGRHLWRPSAAPRHHPGKVALAQRLP